MVVGTSLASALVMGLVLVAVVLLVRGFGWRTYSPAGGPPRRDVSAMASDPWWWTVGFLLLVAVFGGGSLLAVSTSAASLGTVLAGVGAGVLGLFFVFGIYHSVRSRGGAAARAVGVSIWVLGLLLVGVVTARLLMG